MKSKAKYLEQITPEIVSYFRKLASHERRDQVIRELSEHVYLDLNWEDSFDRVELLDILIDQVLPS